MRESHDMAEPGGERRAALRTYLLCLVFALMVCAGVIVATIWVYAATNGHTDLTVLSLFALLAGAGCVNRIGAAARRMQ